VIVELKLTGISDEDVARDAPYMRHLVATRLEQIWGVCAAHLDPDQGRGDHRYVETGVKVLRQLAQLYRLDAPIPAKPAETPVISAREQVLRGLDALEESRRESQG